MGERRRLHEHARLVGRRLCADTGAAVPAAFGLALAAAAVGLALAMPRATSATALRPKPLSGWLRATLENWLQL